MDKSACEMRDDDPLCIDVNILAAERIDDILVGEAMKAVTADALVTELTRQARQRCEVRHAMMKSGIEAGDLGQGWPGASDCGDSGQIMRLMQRSKRRELAQARLQRLRYKCGAITFRAAMDDAVPNGRQTSARGVLVDCIQKQT